MVKFKKLRGNKYRVIFDDKEVDLYEDVIVDNSLLLKKEISDDELKELVAYNNDLDGYYKSLKYIERKMRSVKEIRDYLLKLNISSKVSNDIVERLIKEGYLDDKMYASAFVNDRINLSNYGPKKIEKELLKKGVSRSIIEDVIVVYSRDIEVSKIDKYINKSLKSNKKSSYMFKEKVKNNLLNLGYSLSVISERLSLIDVDDRDNYDREYKKVYDRLSRKYSGSELLYKVKQKMYQKGFRN